MEFKQANLWEKRSSLWGVGERESEKSGEKVQTFSYKINTSEMMYNVMTIAHTAV